MTTIIPINKLKNTAYISETCHSTKEAIYITKNGYADIVMMAAEVYEEMEKELIELRAKLEK